MKLMVVFGTRPEAIKMAPLVIHLIEPLDYLPFVYRMKRCHIILTDSAWPGSTPPTATG